MATQYSKDYWNNVLEYHEGHVYWRVANSNMIKVGDEAGHATAHKAYCEVAEELFGEFANDGGSNNDD